MPVQAFSRIGGQSLFRFDRIEAGLWILDLTHFPDANRFPPTDRVRGRLSLENALWARV
jgi:hypothetical protein